MEFDYTATTTKTFDQAVQSVQDEVAKNGMRVLYVHDVQKTLIILSQFFPQTDLGEKPKEIDQIIQNIVNNAK